MKTIAGSVIAVTLLWGVTPSFGREKDPSDVVPQYNVKTEIEFKGTIAKVSEVAAGNAYAGVHLAIDTKTGTFEVYLGPADFIKLLDFPIRAGMKDIVVIGSRVKSEGDDLVLAREVRVGVVRLSLRGEKGFPNWLWATRSGITSGL